MVLMFFEIPLLRKYLVIVDIFVRAFNNKIRDRSNNIKIFFYLSKVKHFNLIQHIFFRKKNTPKYIKIQKKSK